MPVLKTTSPTEDCAAPNEAPNKIVPSSRMSFAVIGSRISEMFGILKGVWISIDMGEIKVENELDILSKGL